MLPVSSQSPASGYSSLYELIVPPDNLLRKIKDLLDFSFIHEELQHKYCLDNGRLAQSPIRLFKYLLLKSIYTLSDVDVVERSRYDMSFKYFLEMTPEEDVIDASSLTKFRKLRLQDTHLLDLLINKTVLIAIEKGIIKSKSIIVDSTHSHSKSNPYSALEVLRNRSKHLRKAVYRFDEGKKGSMPAKNTQDDLAKELEYCQTLKHHIETDVSLSSSVAIKEQLNLLQETIEDTQEHYILSKDTDAKVGHKSADSSFFGYKTHIAMTEERIITAAVVTSAEKGDGPQLPMLLKISQHNGIQVDTIIGDTAYSGKENLDLAKQQHIQVVAKLLPSISQGARKDQHGFHYNKDAAMVICPAGHMAIRKAKQGRKNVPKNQSITYYFDVDKCKHCPFKVGCYKEGSKTKTYAITIKSDLHQEQIAFQQTPFFKQKAEHRYKIEAKNSELKNVHGYQRAIAYGITNMQMQGAMAIFTVNLKRIIKLSK
jgi:Transposase DDE domain/Transposase domain (DUF772)